MKPISLISNDLFDKVRSRFSNLEMGDEKGIVTLNPRDARFFDFDFNIQGNNLGRVSVSINEPGNLKIFYGQGILDGTDPITQDIWFKFLKEMRNFAKRRMMRFDTRDITKSNLKKEDFKYLATSNKEEAMSESRMTGSKYRSYKPLENARMIVRHKKPVDGSRGSRSRHVESIFIENQLGERYKMPYNETRTANAMLRHVANGGRPYDAHGEAIVEMGMNLMQLREFKRRCLKTDSMQETAHQIVEKAFGKLESLKSQLESICKQSGYESWKSSFESMPKTDVLIDEATLADYKNKFSETTFREELSQYFPLLHNIMREAGEIDLAALTNEQTESSIESNDDSEGVKELSVFEQWMDDVASQKLTDDVIKKLKEFLESDPVAGVDGTNAIESLKEIGVENDELTDMIKKSGAEGDIKTVLTLWLTERGDFDTVEKLELKPTNQEEPTPELPAPSETPQPTAEGKGNIKPKIKAIAEMVKSFYNAEAAEQGLGCWPIGETAIVTKVEKQFGEKAGKVAEQFIQELTRKHESQIYSENVDFQDILRLSGIKK